MRRLPFTGVLLVLFCSCAATPAGAVPVSTPRPSASADPALSRRFAPSALYSRRSRRLVQSYLRLKLLQMREGDLDRARKVVERKLGIGALLGETPKPYAR